MTIEQIAINEGLRVTRSKDVKNGGKSYMSYKGGLFDLLCLRNAYNLIKGNNAFIWCGLLLVENK